MGGSLHVLKPKAAIIGVFVVLVLPLWIGLAWALGLIRIGAEPAITNQAQSLNRRRRETTTR